MPRLGALPVHQIHRRPGHQRAAHAIQIAAAQIDHLDQPLAQRAVGLHRDTHAAITDRAGRLDEVPGDLAYG